MRKLHVRLTCEGLGWHYTPRIRGSAPMEKRHESERTDHGSTTLHTLGNDDDKHEWLWASGVLFLLFMP